MLVNELVALLEKQDPNKEIRIEVERTCGIGGCDCTAGEYDYETLDVNTTDHEFIVIS
jgi:hypothetical protein